MSSPLSESSFRLLLLLVVVAVTGVACAHGKNDPMRQAEKSAAVQDLLRKEEWRLAEVSTSFGPGLIRWRRPVLSGQRHNGYGRVLKVVWAYAPDGSAALPSDADSDRMKVFENRLCEAVEHDVQAVLAAVLTFDGARQWVFYTDDAKEFLSRLEAMPQEPDPYPLEMTVDDDPEWGYLRDEILKRVDPKDQ